MNGSSQRLSLVLRHRQHPMQYQLGDGLNRHPPSWQQQGAAHGYNPNKRGRLSHHPLLAFVAEARRVANFWLRPGGVHSANNVLPLIESTLLRLGSKSGGLLRAESGVMTSGIQAILAS